MVTYYVIRNRTTGRYIKGTPAYYSWSADPRLFLNIGRLRGFVTSVMTHTKRARLAGHNTSANLSNWVVDEMILTTMDTKELHQVVTGKKIMELLTV
jgi:hypothetical protein